MTTNSPDQVDGDVQVLINFIQREKVTCEEIDTRDFSEPEMDDFKRYGRVLDIALAALTPPAQLLRPVELPDVKNARSDWSTWQWIEHLGGRFQNGNPGGYIEFGSVYAVAQMMKQYRRTVTAEVIAEIAEALRQQGYEVKNG